MSESVILNSNQPSEPLIQHFKALSQCFDALSQQFEALI